MPCATVPRAHYNRAVPTWLVGTSGFSYDGWRGIFYPPGLPRWLWLEFYAREFRSVELNVTFYRTPRESTYRGWVAATDPGFSFVLKVPRLVSHIKRLADCRQELERFWSGAQLLGQKLAAVLLQTPPSLRFDAALLDGFLASLPAGFPSLAWEVRHASFLDDEALAWFARSGQSLVVADSGGRYPTIRAFTAPPAYLRFHGPAGLYTSPYSEGQLADYAVWVGTNVPEDATVYAFFNNDVGGHAVTNARQLRALVEARPTPA
jgi:uncharacterized protein YecE (DUF72 family)